MKPSDSTTSSESARSEGEPLSHVLSLRFPELHPLIGLMLRCSPLRQAPVDVDGVLLTPEPLQQELPPRIDLAGSDGRWGSSLWQWLVEGCRRAPMHLAPSGQVEQIHALTPVLFSYFQVEQGALQLGGCNLVDRPMLRRTTVSPQGDQWSHEHFALDGSPLDHILVEDLGLDHLDAMAGRPPMSMQQRAAWEAFVEQQPKQQPMETPESAEQIEQDASGGAACHLSAMIWCKYAIGELNATGDGQRRRLPFEGWAAQLLNRRVAPPPFTEPATGDSSYQLVRLDDGSLTAASAAASCEASGKRVLRSELRSCAATGRLALPEFFVTCPVTGDLVMDDSLRLCDQCRQPVGAHCVDERGVCLACRSLKPAGPEDPRLARILGEHPGLGLWRRWRLAETSEVYVLTGAALLRQLILVLDHKSLAPKHVAVRSRFARQWRTPSDLEQQELLDGS